jgi:hypothetical protein
MSSTMADSFGSAFAGAEDDASAAAVAMHRNAGADGLGVSRQHERADVARRRTARRVCWRGRRCGGRTRSGTVCRI